MTNENCIHDVNQQEFCPLCDVGSVCLNCGAKADRGDFCSDQCKLQYEVTRP